MLIICQRCGAEVDAVHLDRRFCDECTKVRNRERTRKMHEAERRGWNFPRAEIEGHHWKLIKTPPGHEDLIGIELAEVDFDYGDYSYLAGSLMMRAGREYIFDGRKARERV